MSWRPGRGFHDVSNVLTASVQTLNITGELLLYHENSFNDRRGERVVDEQEVARLNYDTCVPIRM